MNHLPGTDVDLQDLLSYIRPLAMLPFPGKLAGPEETQMKFPHAVRWFPFGLMLLMIPAALSSPSAAQIGIGIGISVRIGPPALPVYEQPFCPGPGFLWTPGYWAWDDDEGYYWVPGTWVEAPEPGFLWTPGYWGWNNGVYAWNGGYWGEHVGFYGGINYGFGYGGNGFFGGEWRGGSFFYNTAVMRVNTTQITNVYVNRTVIVNSESHVAFNGGEGGVSARPTAEQEQWAHERHIPPVAAQVQHVKEASQNRANFARVNNGKPAIAATPRPGVFKGPGVVTAKAAGAPYHAPTMSPKEARAPAPAANRGAEGKPGETRPAENRPAPKAAESRPAANRPAPKPAESRPAENRPAPKPANHPAPAANRSAPERPENAAKPSAPRESAPRPSESHAAAKPAPKPAPRETARPASQPRAESKPSPAPRASAPKESAPKESAPRAATPKPAPAPRPAPAAKPAPAPKPQRSAPPKENPPKEERK